MLQLRFQYNVSACSFDRCPVELALTKSRTTRYKKVFAYLADIDQHMYETTVMILTELRKGFNRRTKLTHSRLAMRLVHILVSYVLQRQFRFAGAADAKMLLQSQHVTAESV
jgi:hypothetical protein